MDKLTHLISLLMTMLMSYYLIQILVLGLALQMPQKEHTAFRCIMTLMRHTWQISILEPLRKRSELFSTRGQVTLGFSMQQLRESMDKLTMTRLPLQQLQLIKQPLLHLPRVVWPVTSTLMILLLEKATAKWLLKSKSLEMLRKKKTSSTGISKQLLVLLILLWLSQE